MSFKSKKLSCWVALATAALFCTLSGPANQANAGIIWSGPGFTPVDVSPGALNTTETALLSITGFQDTSLNSFRTGTGGTNSQLYFVTFQSGIRFVSNDPTSGFNFVEPQTVGAVISSSSSFNLGSPEWLQYVAAGSGSGTQNSVALGTDLYLGFRSATNQYGWIRYSASGNIADGYSMTVSEWAYNSTPNTQIEVGAIPEPSGLTMVALGGLAVAGRRWRRIGQKAAA